MKSQAPFKITAALALCCIAIIAAVHKVVDTATIASIIVALLTYAAGLITHTEIPDEEWERRKKEKDHPPSGPVSGP